MKKMLTIALTGLTLLLAIPVQAETLLEIYDKAKRNDPSIREAEANMMATLQSKPKARAKLLPAVDATAGWSKSKRDGDTTSEIAGGAGGTTKEEAQTIRSDTTQWKINFSQTLFNANDWRSLKKADKEVARAQADYLAAKQDLMLRVSEAYFNVLAAQDTLASERAAKDAIGRQLEQANRRFEVGLIAITDVKEAQAGYDDAVALEISAQRSLATNKEALREITGEYPEKLANPGAEFPLIPPEPQVEQDWVDISMQQNLALESAKIGAEITRDNISIARTGHLPTVDFTASYGNTDSEGRNTFPDAAVPEAIRSDSSGNLDNGQFGIQINLPIFSGGGVSSQVQEQVYLHRASRENYEKVARSTERETRDAYLGVIAEIARVQALARSEDSNKTALEATEAGYDVGTRTTVDVLNARQSLFLAQTNYARAKYDYLINVIKLKQAAGTLSEDDIRLLDGWLVTTEELSSTPGRGDTPDTELPATVIEDGETIPMDKASGDQPTSLVTPKPGTVPAAENDQATADNKSGN
ncbi:MAG: TolC family outer membrane protein [Gammaproteobacteria bacterium]|nr:TolC family outer membrane protein [Gammaproteobacteria bacterium]MCP4088541.1 TolC family outer membrane protein [Gammaproteobacteria bacterium]MCP4276719.1 TolC family outer membrane protein [Gammaproteobacteria bacterium]MCP4832428.1 TolC family outer membrane protein [Gammaproteobacteria bacterium]MCP4929869.1 TolC family outer membrane protein [Gammaproteobacteria bacterium]